MISAALEGPSAGAAILQLIPLILAVSALFPGGSPTGHDPTGPQDPSGWRRAERVAASAFLLAGLAALLVVAGGGPLGAASPAAVAGATRVDALTLTMLLLVTAIAWAIVRFCRRYLDGDPGARRARRWFQATVAAVCLLVLTDHLMVLAFAWVATSLALHQLLTHFDERPAALIAAHKKFLASRVAEVGVFAGVALIVDVVGSDRISELFRHLAEQPGLDPRLEVAACLLAFAAVLKCAQMPFHGWLIQVMEAPTPVSALLHAGVVNIGGFLMIRLAPLIAEAETASLLLVAWGSANAVTAALVTTTRVSIKVGLAWSTSAQMGFMLLECGLGAFSLALLHLVAHSLYKAHAFLTAGNVVEQYRIAALSPAKGPVALRRWIAALPLAALVTVPVALVFDLDPRREPALLALGPIFVFALVPLVAHGLAGGPARLGFALLGAAGLATLYGLGHAGFGRLLDGPEPGSVDGARIACIAIALGAFTLLFVVQGILSARPEGALARALYPRLFAGLYLDDLFTRLTFRLWPARLPGAAIERTVGTYPS
ncbi:MAG: NADH-quinone oxidoreductase subunit L [Myxococcota bacterium]